MSFYEGMFLLDHKQANRDWDGCIGHIKEILEKHGAELLRLAKWGERKLAYEIKKRRRGTYVLTYFSAEGEAPNRIYRECELSEIVLRVLILKVTSVPSEEEMEEIIKAGGQRQRRRPANEPPAKAEPEGKEPKEAEPAAVAAGTSDTATAEETAESADTDEGADPPPPPQTGG